MSLSSWLHRVSASRQGVRADVFDAPAEWVIAQGRLFLCALSLVAIYLEPAQPAHFALATDYMLTGYFIYAVGLVIATNYRLPDPDSQRRIHAGDVLATSLLLFLTEGPTSPFIAFFIFILLAATLRWNWRGVLATLAALAIALIVSSFGQSGAPPVPQPPGSEVTRTVIRTAYFAVMAGMLAYVGAYRERSHERLANLAEWPAYITAPTDSPAFASTLAHAANVLGAPRVIAIWEEAEEPFVKLASWDQGRYQQITEPAGTFGDLVAPALTTSAFSTENANSYLALLRTGHMRLNVPLVHPDFLRRFRIIGMASAPFAGSICRGRMFIVDRSNWGYDHLLLTEIIAARMAIELDRQVLQAQAEDMAALRERIGLARDLHDGVLQSLTAAGLQLKLATQDLDEETRTRIDVVKQLLANEQRQIREFVQAMRPTTSLRQVALTQNLRQALAKAASSWNCALSFTVKPDDSSVPKKLETQLSLMLSEAIANAVRHGQASNVDVAVLQTDDALSIAVRDNGRGFDNSVASIGERNQPRAFHPAPASLQGRVNELGGSLEVLSSSAGAELRIRLPMS
jgi:signal transduction histidine kinase